MKLVDLAMEEKGVQGLEGLKRCLWETERAVYALGEDILIEKYLQLSLSLRFHLLLGTPDPETLVEVLTERCVHFLHHDQGFNLKPFLTFRLGGGAVGAVGS